MILARALLFTATTVLATLASEAHGATTFAGLADQVTGAINHVLPPSSLKCSINRLRDVLRPQVYEAERLIGLSNQGMELHFSHLMRANPCLSKTAHHFWTEIEKEGETQSAAFSSKPALNERAGQGRYSAYKEGWLWEKAMRATGGNPIAAMSIISLCMHDDGKIRVMMSEQEDEPTSSLTCPGGTNPAFAPRSVDSNLDLPESLKNAIALVQKPQGGPQDLPAKTYHFVAGGYIGCQLAQCDVSPEQAEQVAGILAGTYRAMRLCPEAKHKLERLQLISDEIDVDPANPKFQEMYLKYLAKVFSSGGSSINEPWVAEQLERARKELVELDAAMLFSNWYVGGPNALSGNIPCTTLRLSGPDLINILDPVKEKAPEYMAPQAGTICRIPGWTVERCEKARMKLSTWDIDFSWTITQHRLGARFGAKHCATPKSAQNLDQLTCSKR